MRTMKNQNKIENNENNEKQTTKTKKNWNSSKRQKGERVTDNNSTITTSDEIQTVQQLKMKVKQW